MPWLFSGFIGLMASGSRSQSLRLERSGTPSGMAVTDSAALPWYSGSSEPANVWRIIRCVRFGAFLAVSVLSTVSPYSGSGTFEYLNGGDDSGVSPSTWWQRAHCETNSS